MAAPAHVEQPRPPQLNKIGALALALPARQRRMSESSQMTISLEHTGTLKSTPTTEDASQSKMPKPIEIARETSQKATQKSLLRAKLESQKIPVLYRVITNPGPKISNV